MIFGKGIYQSESLLKKKAFRYKSWYKIESGLSLEVYFHTGRMQQDILHSDAFTTTQISLKRPGDGCCSRQDTFILLWSSHVFVFSTMTPGTALRMFDTSSTHPLGSRWILRRISCCFLTWAYLVVIQSFMRRLAGETPENFSLRHLHSHIRPLQRLSGEFSACLKAL